MFPARVQLFTLFRDTKWIAAVSIALSILLYFPAQISELYRATLADRNVGDLVEFYGPLFALGAFVWLGANQIALESTSRQPAPHPPWLGWITRIWPILLGILPIVASALSQFLSIPTYAEQAIADLDRVNLL